MNKDEAKIKIDALTAPLEPEVGNLLLNFNLELIACGRNSRVFSSGKEIGQIDFVFKDKEVAKIFLVEVSTEKTRISSKITRFLSRWSNRANLDMVRSQFRLPSTYKIVRLFFELSGIQKIPESITYLSCKENKILLRYDFECFLDAYHKIGMCARGDFFSYLDIQPPNKGKNEKKAIVFYFGDTRAYSYVDSAKNLLRYCYVFRRRRDEKEYQGYQRILKTKRIDSIAKGILTGVISGFPNTILINAPSGFELCSENKDKTDSSDTVTINVPNNFYACRVIDGQHRLLSYAKLPQDIQESHFIPVIVLENMEIGDEMKTFIQINSGQEKIKRNLILALRADFDWNVDINPKEFFEKQAVEIAMKLNNTSPLKGKIDIPHALSEEKGKIALSTLVRQIITNNFIGKKVHLFQKDINDVATPYKILRKVFSLTIQKTQKYSGDEELFLITNKGLRILLRLVQIYERNRLKGYVKVSLVDFFDDISNALTEKLVDDLKSFFGAAGAIKGTEKVVRRLRYIEKRRYRKFIYDLRKLKL